jgi:hypothetical protein
MPADPFEDIAASLAQIEAMLSALGRMLEGELAIGDRLQLEDAQERLIRRRAALRRDWWELVERQYPTAN